MSRRSARTGPTPIELADPDCVWAINFWLGHQVRAHNLQVQRVEKGGSSEGVWGLPGKSRGAWWSANASRWPEFNRAVVKRDENGADLHLTALGKQKVLTGFWLGDKRLDYFYFPDLDAQLWVWMDDVERHRKAVEAQVELDRFTRGAGSNCRQTRL